MATPWLAAIPPQARSASVPYHKHPSTRSAVRQSGPIGALLRPSQKIPGNGGVNANHDQGNAVNACQISALHQKRETALGISHQEPRKSSEKKMADGVFHRQPGKRKYQQEPIPFSVHAIADNQAGESRKERQINRQHCEQKPCQGEASSPVVDKNRGNPRKQQKSLYPECNQASQECNPQIPSACQEKKERHERHPGKPSLVYFGERTK